MPLSIEPLGSRETGVCSCCGSTSRLVWGTIRHVETAVALYQVHWTADQVAQHGAHFDLVMAFDGDNTKDEDRCFVSLAYRMFATGPSFMVIDANERPFSNGQAGQIFAREDVIGTDIAGAAFEAVDTILSEDLRVSELLRNQH